eukprot:scaffold12132_cov103-Isochrysis_galbana.AAC.7
MRARYGPKLALGLGVCSLLGVLARQTPSTYRWLWLPLAPALLCRSRSPRHDTNSPYSALLRIRMEYPPADARAAPSAPAPNDTVMDIASSPKRPRDPAPTPKDS